jgi:hypothetical protein
MVALAEPWPFKSEIRNLARQEGRRESPRRPKSAIAQRRAPGTRHQAPETAVRPPIRNPQSPKGGTGDQGPGTRDSASPANPQSEMHNRYVLCGSSRRRCRGRSHLRASASSAEVCCFCRSPVGPFFAPSAFSAVPAVAVAAGGAARIRRAAGPGAAYNVPPARGRGDGRLGLSKGRRHGARGVVSGRRRRRRGPRAPAPPARSPAAPWRSPTAHH